MVIYCNLSIKSPEVGGGGDNFIQLLLLLRKGMKRDRGLINFDCSKGARERMEGGGEGGLTVRLH